MEKEFKEQFDSEVIEFYLWIQTESKYHFVDNTLWFLNGDFKSDRLTTQQLYKLWKTNK